MSNILKYQNPSSPLLNPHKIIENVPAREWGPRKINEDYTVTEGKGTNFWRAPFQYLGNKGRGIQNEKLARDLVSEFDQMRSENPDYNYTLDKNYQSYDDAINYINHLEGLKKYLHLPYDTGLLMESKYKPTRLQGTNEKTYKFRSSMTPGYWNDVVDDMVFGEYSKNQYYDQSLNEFTAYRDRDEKGDFVSIYDEWDYNPAVRGGNKKWNKLIDTLTGGTPFVIYDRVYLDDYYDIPEEARGNPFITPAVVTAYKKGGNIHIKKKNRGKFTEYCGGKVTEECIAKGKNSKDPKIRKRATFAANARKWKHENGGILKAQEGTGNGFWSKLWNAVKEGGMAARDAKLGAVGAQQVRDLYSEGKNQEAQNLAKQYAKANTTGIALAGGAASTGLLGDLMVTGATTAADTFIDGDVDNFGKNLVKNAAGDLIGHGVGKVLRKGWNKIQEIKPISPLKTNIEEYINTIDDDFIDPVHLERMAKSEQIDRFNRFAKKYGYSEITDMNISNTKLDELTRDMLERHNTYFRGVRPSKEVSALANKLGISEEEALKIAATTPRAGETHIFVSPVSNAGIYGGRTVAKIRRPYKLGHDRTKWFNEANFQVEPPHYHGGNPQAEVIYPWHGSYPETKVPNELLLKKGEFIEWMNNAKVDDYVGSNNRVFSNYDSFTGLEFLPLEKFKQGGKL